MQSVYRKSLEDYLKTLKITDKRVIDIGGSQNPVLDRVSFDGCVVEIMDLVQPHILKSSPNIIGDLNVQIDIRDPETFDIAFCLEVSEYWYNPVQAIRNIKKFLKKDGMLYITFCYNYPLHPPIGTDMLRYTKNSVYKLLEDFEILEYIPRKIKNTDNYAKFICEENYRFKGINFEDIIETGCIVKCRRIKLK